MNVVPVQTSINSEEFEEPWALPTGWSWVKIESVLAPLDDGRIIHHGWSPQCDRLPSKDTASWGVLKTTAIQHGAFLAHENKALPDGLSPRPNLEVRAGDILLTCAGPRSRCGVACLVRSTRPRLIFSGKMYRFRPAPDLMEASFLEAVLQTSYAWSAIDAMKTGGSDSGLNLTHDRFRQLLVPVAPLAEQRRIMVRLESLFAEMAEGDAALAEARKGLEVFRRALLKAAVTGELTKDWRATNQPKTSSSEAIANLRSRYPNASPTKAGWRPKEGLPPLPSGWTWCAIEEAGEVQLGRQRAPQHHSGDNMRPYLRVANVLEDHLDLSDVKSMNFTPVEFETFELRSGDILLNEGQAPDLLGRPAMYRGEIAGCCFQKTLLRFRAKPGVLPEYALVVFRHYMHSGRFKRESRITTNIGHLTQVRFVVMEFPLPPEAEQQAIVEAFRESESAANDVLAILDAEASDAARLKQSVLKAAFEGHLVPQDSEDEPASVLLARVSDTSVSPQKRRGTKTRAVAAS